MKGMKGVVLAGGLGTRLKPLTNTINKHLLPVGQQPMIYYPLQMLAQGGIEEVIVVVGGHGTEEILKQLKDGREFGFKRLYYCYQEGNGGIAQALSLTEEFVAGDDCCVVLGDNVLGGDFQHYVKVFQTAHERPDGKALVLLKKVPNPKAYGVPRFQNFDIVEIVEKPKDPPSDLAVIGVYFYDWRLFDIIRDCKPSARGELEISDVNNVYAKRRALWHSNVGDELWLDAGESIDAWVMANKVMQQKGILHPQQEEFPELVDKK